MSIRPPRGLGLHTEILAMLQANPGMTGVEIHHERVDRWHRDSRLGRHIPRDSLLAILFGPNLASMHAALASLEGGGLIRGQWGERPQGSPYRRRRYYPRVYVSAMVES